MRGARERLATPVRAGAGRHPPGRRARRRAWPHEDQLVEWRERLDAMGDTTATFEWAFRWLDAAPAGAVAAASWCTATSGWETSSSTDPTLPPCWTGSWCTSARPTKTWPGSASGPGGSALRPAGRRRPGQHRKLSVRLRTGQRDYRRSGGVSLVAGAGHAALGGHLPLPGGAAPERAGPLGGAGGDRAPGMRDRVGSARPAEKWPRSDDAGRGPRGSPRAGTWGPAGERAESSTASNVAASATRPRPNLSRRWPNSSRAMCGRPPPGRSTSTPGSPPTCCASSSESCSTTRPTTARAALARARLRRRGRAGRRHPGRRLDERADDTAGLRTLVRHRLAVAHPGYDSE